MRIEREREGEVKQLGEKLWIYWFDVNDIIL